MRVAEVERFEGVGGIETVFLRLWKCVEKPGEKVSWQSTV
jgi:hypothetical protein